MRTAQQVYALLHGRIVDNADITKIAEVGRQLYLDTVRKAVTRIVDMEYLAHDYRKIDE